MSPSRIRQLVIEGKIKATKIPKHNAPDIWDIPESELDSFLMNRSYKLMETFIQVLNK